MKTKVYYNQTVLDGLDNSVMSLLHTVDRMAVFSLTFFCEVADDEYHSVLDRIRTVVFSFFEKELLVTLIPQKMAEKGTIAVEVHEQLSLDCKMEIGEKDGVHYQISRHGDYSVLCIEGIPSTDFSASVSRQSKEIYARLHAVLLYQEFEISDIVRQWNYIGDITGCRNGLQNYQEYNNARTSFYNQVTWINGYPAATGIGADTHGIIVSCIAVRYSSMGNKIIFPINNPWQTAAHAYSCDVLVGTDGKLKKTTPKFERAKLVKTDHDKYCFVSGTAAIRGEQSDCSVLPAVQIQHTVENVKCLISDENLSEHGCDTVGVTLSNLRVYIKRREDYDVIRHIVEKEFPSVPAVYFITEICRKELLVEIEGIGQA